MNRRILWIILLGSIGVSHPRPAAAADQDAEGNAQKTYYWQGSNLNNLNRLSQGGDFEQEQRRAGDGRDSDQYLSQIREQMAHQAAANTTDKNALDFAGRLAVTPVEVLREPTGVQVILHADLLFDENTAALKAGAMDILARVETLIEQQGPEGLHFVMADRMDAPGSPDLDAERTFAIVSLLEFQLFDRMDVQ